MNKTPNQLINYFHDYIKCKDIKIISFDFFDTLASRAASSYEAFYLQLSQHLKEKEFLISDLQDEQFRVIRMDAEKIAREKSIISRGHPEININEIYEELKFLNNGIFFPVKQDLSKIETDFDLKNLIPARDIIEFINSVSCDINILITTDTFYSAETIKRFAKKIGIKRDFVVFASSEYSFGKYSKMFGEIVSFAERYGVGSSNILHIGDNYNSDYLCSKNYGINAIHIPYGDSTFWQSDYVSNQYLENFSSRQRLVCKGTPLRVLVARSIPRISNDLPDKNDYFGYGVRSMGPIVAGFTYWLHNSAKKNHIDIFLFMMREGELLCEAYKKSRKFSNDLINSELLYVSRKVLKQAALESINKENLKEFLLVDHQSIQEYLELLGINYSDIIIITDKLSINPKQSIGDCFEVVINFIMNSSDIKNKIYLSSKKIRESFLIHFKKQLGSLVDKEKLRVGLVDVGWGASIQKSLCSILSKNIPNIDIHGYYISTNRGVYDGLFDKKNIRIKAYSYIFQAGLPSRMHDLFMRSPEVIEQSLTSPSKGTLITFSSNGDSVLSDNLLPSLQRSQIKEIQDGILSLIDQLAGYYEVLDCSVSDLESIEWVRSHLLRIICSPTECEIDLFSQWVHDDNLIFNSSNYIINKRFNKWVNSTSVASLKSISMFELYWPYSLLRQEVRENPSFMKLIDDKYQVPLSFFGDNSSDFFVYSDIHGEILNKKLSSGQNNYYIAEFFLDKKFFNDQIEIKFNLLALGLMWELHEVLVSGRNFIASLDFGDFYEKSGHFPLSIEIKNPIRDLSKANKLALIGLKSTLKINKFSTLDESDVFFKNGFSIRLVLKPFKIGL